MDHRPRKLLAAASPRRIAFAAFLVLLLPAATTASAASATVGHLGCSMTAGAVHGYQLLGGEELWHQAPWGGGSIDRWASPDYEHWSEFTAQLADNPSTGTIWLQLCKRAEVPGDSYTMVIDVLSILRSHVGSMPVYISAQPDYLVATCDLTGSGPSEMEALVDRLVAEGQALRGPEMPVLTPLTTMPDGCHGNPVGNAQMGLTLREFFG